MVKGGSLKILVPLAIAASALTIVLYQQQERSRSERFERRKLFPELDVGAIRKIRIELKDEELVLQGQGEDWEIASLPGFPIEAERLRELILGLGDLEISDRMTQKPENYERLGVQDESPAGGRIQVLGESDSVLADLIVGDERRRQSGSPGGFSPAEGQYVRTKDDPWVYQATDLVTLTSERSRWLQKDILKVPAKDFRRIRIDNTASTESLTLVRDQSGELQLQEDIPEDMQVKSWAINNVGRALANLSLTDVLPADEAGVEFDATFSATQKNGLVYLVETGRKEAAHFAKVGARYEPALNLGLSDERTSDTVEARKMPDPETQARKINERHRPWVYEISEFAYENLTKLRSALLEPVPEEVPPPDDTAFPGSPPLDLSQGAGADQEIESFLEGLDTADRPNSPAP